MKSIPPSGLRRSRARLFCICLFVAACVGPPRTPPIAEAPSSPSESTADVEVVAAEGPEVHARLPTAAIAGAEQRS